MMKKNILRSELNHVSLPLLLNSLLGTAMSVIFTAMIGRISSDAIAATEVVDGLVYSLVGILGAGSLSFNIYASRIQESNPRLFQNYFKSILFLNLLLGGIGTLLVMMLLPELLAHLYHFKGETLVLGISYGRISAFKLVIYVTIFSFSNQLKVKKKPVMIVTAGVISSLAHLLMALAAFAYLPKSKQLLGLGVASMFSLLMECGLYCVVLRKGLRMLKGIKSSQKWFLLKKSGPLFGQECLEGTLFSVIVTALVSRLPFTIFTGYSLCLVIVKLAQSAMFPYANSQLILIGEAFGKGQSNKLRQLPKLTAKVTLASYLGVSLIVVCFSSSLLPLLSNQSELIHQAMEILPVVLLFFTSQLFFEINKYSLQAIGKERQTLILTGMVNGLVVCVLLVLQLVGLNSLMTILWGLAINYLWLSFLFSRFYRKTIQNH
ncbi:MATE family efflux transporter [uncultured Vagococcus sp.]|uniref:MATE family efflux transporter n=1 Tax=uncultured Vagococcus sp. TaxID=189676 RepID=UPI0028D0ED77|nr:MATE family efflux transporter [uncultured Vagococcus sp.]